MSDSPLEPIAVVGLGVRFPGADDPDAFWANLRDGRTFLGRSGVESDRAVASPRTHAPVARLDRIDGFDWRAFSIPPNQARYLDPQHRLLLEVVWESLEDADVPTGTLQGSRTAVYVGLQWNDYLRLQSRDPTRADSYALTGNLFHFAANRVSHVFGLQGPSMAIDMGCASSLAVVHAACQSLRLGESDLAIAAAVELVLAPDSTSMMEQAGLLDRRDDCRTFDALAGGFARGEGAGAVILMRASDVGPGDRVYATVLGTAVNHNGRTDWITAPSEAAQTQVIREAWARSGVSPEQLDYVELHGTASPSGDATAAAALGAALAPRPKGSRPLRVGSVKTQIGHLGAASAIAGLCKVVLALHHREIPPGLRIDRPNPNIPFESLGFQPQTELSSWPTDRVPPLAGVTATSLSGANAHLVVRGQPRRSASKRVRHRGPGTHLLPVSARSSEALRQLCRKFCDYLTECRMPIEDIAYSASVRREHYESRFCSRGASLADWIAALRNFLADDEQSISQPASADPARDAYLSGEKVDWAAILPEGCQLVSLPTYPWQRQRFWLPDGDRTPEPVVERVGRLGETRPSDAGAAVTQQLASILGVDSSEIAGSGSPVELGLDSLRALQLAHGLERALGVQVAVSDILAVRGRSAIF